MKKAVCEKIKMSGDIPQPRFGHTFTMVSKTKGVLFGGAVSVSGKQWITQVNLSLQMKHLFMIFLLVYGKNWTSIITLSLVKGQHMPRAL